MIKPHEAVATRPCEKIHKALTLVSAPVPAGVVVLPDLPIQAQR